jgi:hypothetical protein
MLSNALPLATRAKTQGAVDLWITVAGAGGGMGPGIVVASTSYATLSLVGGLIALASVSIVAMSSAQPRATNPPSV